MNIIKLDAIDSTNTFLKDLVSSRPVENFTVVQAENQTNGRGQMGCEWVSDKGKNLTFSILGCFSSFKALDSVFLNYSISLALLTTLEKLKVPKLKVKWPNDIMADSKKIGGVLIENSLKGKFLDHSIIGIGLNVNQTIFNDALSGANSIRNCLGKEINKDALLLELITSLKAEIENCIPENFKVIKNRYLEVLYKKEIPTMFKDSEDLIFLGKIINVSDSGKLQIELENGSVREFGIKEIQILTKL